MFGGLEGFCTDSLSMSLCGHLSEVLRAERLDVVQTSRFGSVHNPHEKTLLDTVADGILCIQPGLVRVLLGVVTFFVVFFNGRFTSHAAAIPFDCSLSERGALQMAAGFDLVRSHLA
ncbi:MAG TPA: hypothetical protein VGF98_01115 [Candidatus Tumulicola sp.]